MLKTASAIQNGGVFLGVLTCLHQTCFWQRVYSGHTFSSMRTTDMIKLRVQTDLMLNKSGEESRGVSGENV